MTNDTGRGLHRAIASGRCGVVTGAASGIGLALARRLVASGMAVALVDLPGERLTEARDTLIRAGADSTKVVALPTDVSDPVQVRKLASRVHEAIGPVHVLFANAGIQPGSSVLDEADTWDRVICTNLMGIVRTVQAFVPDMIAGGAPGLVVCTGSKQGITTPPGDPAYNVSKAGVKVFAESLQHDLRNRSDCQVEARLFVPGFVFTPLSANGRAERPDAAWTPEQCVDFLFDALSGDDFYILCPDGDVDRATDIKRIRWAAGDIIENRPPLSRWHPAFDKAFQQD